MDEWKWILVNILGFQSDFVCLIRRFSVIKDSAVLCIWLFMYWAGGKCKKSSEWLLLLYCFCWQRTADKFVLKKIQMQTSDKSSWSWYTNCFCMVKVTLILPPGHYDDLSLSAVIELIGEEIKRVNIGCKLLIHAKLLFKKGW